MRLRDGWSGAGHGRGVFGSAGTSQGGQANHRDTSDRSREHSQTGSRVEVAGDHTAQSTIATVGRKVERIALVGGEDGACLSVCMSMIKYSHGLNLQSKLSDSQKKMDHPHTDEW